MKGIFDNRIYIYIPWVRFLSVVLCYLFHICVCVRVVISWCWCWDGLHIGILTRSGLIGMELHIHAHVHYIDMEQPYMEYYIYIVYMYMYMYSIVLDCSASKVCVHYI